jgi:hypothetical protein
MNEETELPDDSDMQNLTPLVLAAKSESQTWDRAAFRRVLRIIGRKCPDMVVESRDIDSAGEKWARVYGGALEDGFYEHFGIIWSDGPLCFLSPRIAECAGPKLRENGIVVVTVDDLNAVRYRIDPTVVEEVFGSEWDADAADADQMSILDLEWMTN